MNCKDDKLINVWDPLHKNSTIVSILSFKNLIKLPSLAFCVGLRNLSSEGLHDVGLVFRCAGFSFGRWCKYHMPLPN